MRPRLLAKLRPSALAAAVAAALLAAPAARPEIASPWKSAFVGALDAGAWNGLILAMTKDAAFGFRFRAVLEDRRLDGDDLFYMVSEVGPNSPDGLYARVRFDLSLPVPPGDRNETPILIKPSDPDTTMTLEWSRQDEGTVVGRVLAPKRAGLELVAYAPWETKVRFRGLAEGGISAEPAGSPVRGLIWTDPPGEAGPAGEGDELVRRYAAGRGAWLYFAASAGTDPGATADRLDRFRSRKAIDALLAEERARYGKKRVRVEGLFEGAAEAVTNNLHWMVLYQPGAHRLYTPAGRRWIFNRPDGGPGHWQIFAWDSFFNALELAVESPDDAVSAIDAVLETQYPNGNIPNWRSRFGGTPDRSQPPVGAYCVLRLFQRTGDIDLLRRAYPVLARWHAFWKARKPNGRPRRDGNGDGLLEWGSDRELVSEQTPAWEVGASAEQRAKWESGQDDLPSWDDVSCAPESGSLSMNCLDLNCLYALDAWCLGQIAQALDRREESEALAAEYETTRGLINDHLWNAREGFYFDRHWDGRFSTRKAASSFYVLAARIPDASRARLVLRHLLDPKEFWGEHVLPTISRDDPAFNDPANPSRQYWRGTIWPPTNYLVYQGLKAYGFDAVASEFARKSAGLFLRTWKSFQLCPENFHPLSGEAAGQRFQSWGPLFALIGLEEYLDFTPWDGFRFGMIEPEDEGRLSRIAIQGRHYDVEVDTNEVLLREEGRPIVEIDGGAVVRRFVYAENEVAFDIKSAGRRRISVAFLKKGKYQLLIDDVLSRVFRGRSVKLDVPAGDHTVLLQLLEEDVE